MVEANPYIAPTSDLVHDTGELGDAAVFSFTTRIGRLRYLARVSLFTVASYLLLGILVGALAMGSNASGASILVGYGLFFVASVVFGLMFATQRLHDLNHGGGWSVLLFVPLLNVVMGLYLLFAGGTGGKNDYGAPPPPNTLGIKLAALIVPMVFVIGIIAGIAIPAYQEYATRAQQAQIQTELE